MSEPRWLELEDLERIETAKPRGKEATNGHAVQEGSTERSTGIPDEFLDWCAPYLGNAELRVMLYIFRRLRGFNKVVDAISMEQFTGGIDRTHGPRLDCGTGLAPRHVRQAIADLAARELIFVEGDSVGGRARMKSFRLNYEAIRRKERPKGVPKVRV